MTSKMRRALLASSIICGSASLVLASPVLAQDATADGQAAAAPAAAPASDAAPAARDELVVTGSRIRQPNLTSVSPVTAVNNREIKLEGTTRVEDLLNNLPQAFADQGSMISNGSSGTATVNLRNLGSSRTLVLIDGRRLMPGDPIVPTADLNFIPAQLVDRVDVVTGGASAVYGADAVAGVVNFIMMKNFEGVRLDAQYSTYQHHNDNDLAQQLTAAHNYQLPSSQVWDGETVDLTGIIGVNSPDGKGNATVYATYRHSDPVTQATRDYSACALGIPSASTPAGFIKKGLTCGGSGWPAVTRFLSNELYEADEPYDLSLQPTGTRPFSTADQYNYAPTNYYQRQDERYTFGAMAHYEINKAADVYAQLMFMDDHTISAAAPSGVYGATVSIPCNSPLLTANQVAALCTAAGLGPTDSATGNIYRRNVEGGPRNADLRHTDYRIVNGIRGDLGHGWTYDIYGQYAATIYNQVFRNDMSTSRTLQALNVIRDPSGNLVCADPVARSQGCAPYDIFSPGGVTQAALDYLQTPGLQTGENVEEVVSGNITGDLGQYGLKSPFANDGVGISLGAEYRRESLRLDVDTEFSSGDLAGQGGPTLPTSGAYDVAEAFGEIRIPLVQDMPFFHDLSLEAGYRYSDYSVGFTSSTYKAGLNWSPVQDVRLRASYNRAVRAPNINELFSGNFIANVLNDDPCASPIGADGKQHPRFTAAQCLNTGITAAQYGKVPYNSSGQYSGLIGGNPDLRPEVSDTYSVGVVLTPRLLPGFNASVDYFDIKVNDIIGRVSPDLILQNCAVSGDQAECSRVHRAANGSLFTGGGYVESLNTNLGFLKTSGIDVTANYRLPLSQWGLDRIGGFELALVGTYLDRLENNPGLPHVSEAGAVDATSFDCEGFYGPVCGTPSPKWRHRLRLGWTTPVAGLTVSGSWRYFAGVTSEQTSSNPYITGSVAGPDRRIAAQSYFDLAATWRVRDSYTLRLGINNILDRDPPTLSLTGAGSANAFFNGNTFPGVYDALGRYMFVGITADF